MAARGRACTIEHDVSCRSLKGEDGSAVLSAKVAGEAIAAFLVVDGHGGPLAMRHVAAQLLGRIVGAVSDASDASPPALHAACRAEFARAHAELRSGSGSKFGASGCTATVVVINLDSRMLTCCNVGDSLAVLVPHDAPVGEGLPDGTAWLQLTADHRVEGNEGEAKRVESLGARVCPAQTAAGKPVGPARVWPGGLAIARALGDADCGEWLSAEPHCSSVLLPAAGATVALCSDGVWDALTMPEVCVVVRGTAQKAHKHKAGAGTQARRVVSAAVAQRGLRDDTTCVLIHVFPSRDAAADRHRLLRKNSWGRDEPRRGLSGFFSRLLSQGLARTDAAPPSPEPSDADEAPPRRTREDSTTLAMGGRACWPPVETQPSRDSTTCGGSLPSSPAWSSSNDSRHGSLGFDLSSHAPGPADLVAGWVGASGPAAA